MSFWQFICAMLGHIGMKSDTSGCLTRCLTCNRYASKRRETLRIVLRLK
jgi:hypothetical protein